VNQQQFENDFPEIASAFDTDFWSNTPAEHPIKYNISRDNTNFFNYLSRLVDQTPVAEIVSQYEHNLYNEGQFRAFLSEMIGYIATERWLCSNPTVLDVKGKDGLPEFECSDIDVEVSRELESTEIDRVRAYLQNELGGDCLAVVEKKESYDDYASGNPEWAQNETDVQELLNKLGSVDRDDVPLTVETSALRLELKESDTDDVEYFGRTGASVITPDKSGKIARTIRQKADKQRNDRPLVVFIDLDLQTVDTVEEVIRETIGEPFTFAFPGDVNVSQYVENADPKWDSYLKEIGAKPNGNVAIPPGSEGVFTEPGVSGIAGVMVRFYHGEVAYIPNVYTEDVDAKSIFNRLGWGMDTQALGSADI